MFCFSSIFRGFLMLTASLAHSLSMADPCDRLPASSIVVKRLEAPIETNFRYGYKTLKGMSADYVRQDIEVLGLTRGQAVAKFQSKSVIQPDPGGRWECASHQLTLEYGFSPMTVYVGKEFPKGSCAYEEILDHEMKHVRTYEAHARKIEREINETLSQRFASSTPVRGGRGETQARLSREINERWIPYITRLLEQVTAEQREVDSPEEYDRVSKSCNGEIKRVIGSQRS